MNHPPSSKGPSQKDQTQPQKLIAHKYIAGHKAKLQIASDGTKLSSEEQLHRASQFALLNGQTSSRYREEFFDQVFIEILSEYFKQWLTSAPEEVKKREFLYQSALALGTVKGQLLSFETFGRNIGAMVKNQQPSDSFGEDGTEGNEDDS